MTKITNHSKSLREIMKKIFWRTLLILGVTLFALLAIDFIIFHGQPSRTGRIFSKDHIELAGSNDIRTQNFKGYDWIYFSSYPHPLAIENIPDFQILLPDNTIIDLKNLKESDIENIASYTYTDPSHLHPNESIITTTYSVMDKIHFIFHKGQLQICTISARPYDTNTFQLITPNGKHYSLPLSEEQAIAIFGEPDEVSTITYD